ncbi:hypothetical protein M404DRAFT_1000835 [Pisolithus tinctorius Marx 270]|uniref:Uncharacterized protein n=1 Tax=Pisolithus tinctorius Marx 270 TaxID=870435 RepID=A0A0C3P8G6_PISTI|nr:hypothetical protein M404DRAFT_1000835 [Pisolithus tinctorius Marx 270]
MHFESLGLILSTTHHAFDLAHYQRETGIGRCLQDIRLRIQAGMDINHDQYS